MHIARPSGWLRAKTSPGTAMRTKLAVASNKEPQLSASNRRPLSPAELKSLSKYMSARKVTDYSPDVSREALGFLSGLIKEREKDLELVEGAVLLVEQANIRDASPRDLSLSGVWQLIFTSAGGFIRLQYTPVNEYFYIYPKEKTVEIITELGPITTAFKGSSEWDGATNTLCYSVRQVDIKLGAACWTWPFKLDNQLAMFHRDATLACGRSAISETGGSGGIILFVKKGEAPGAS